MGVQADGFYLAALLQTLQTERRRGRQAKARRLMAEANAPRKDNPKVALNKEYRCTRMAGGTRSSRFRERLLNGSPLRVSSRSHQHRSPAPQAAAPPPFKPKEDGLPERLEMLGDQREAVLRSGFSKLSIPAGEVELLAGREGQTDLRADLISRDQRSQANW